MLCRVGASYTGALQLPVLGQQSLRLTVTTDRQAQITLAGAINLNEPIEYSLGPEGKLAFILNEATDGVLKRLGTRLLQAEYHKANDSSEITIAPPLVPAIRVQLMRAEATAPRARQL